MAQSGSFGLTIRAVDQASGTLDKINRNLAKLHGPVDKLQSQLTKFNNVSGLNAVASGFSKVKSGIESTMGVMSRFVPMLGILAGGSIIAGLVTAAASSFKLAQQIKLTAGTLGMNTQQLREWRKASELATGSATALEEAFKGVGDAVLQAKIGNNNTLFAMMKQWKVSMDLPEDKQAEELAKHIHSIQNPAVRRAAYSAAGMDPIAGEAMAGGADYEKALGQAKKSFTPNEDQNKALVDANFAVVAAEQALQGRIDQLAVTAAPNLTTAIDKLTATINPKGPNNDPAKDGIKPPSGGELLAGAGIGALVLPLLRPVKAMGEFVGDLMKGGARAGPTVEKAAEVAKVAEKGIVPVLEEAAPKVGEAIGLRFAKTALHWLPGLGTALDLLDPTSTQTQEQENAALNYPGSEDGRVRIPKAQADAEKAAAKPRFVSNDPRTNQPGAQSDVDAHAATVSNLIAQNGPLGSLSAKYESGGKGVSTISSGADDPGGVSYGAHQLASQTGTMSAFINSQEGSRYADSFKGLTPGTEAFNDAYRKVVAGDSDGFEKAQHDYIQRTHYKPVEAHARELGIDTSNPAIQQALWSMGVQHGGANRILDAAVKSGVDLKDNAAVLKALYSSRNDYVDGISGMNDKTKQSLHNRYAREQQDALAMNGKITIDVNHSGAQPPGFAMNVKPSGPAFGGRSPLPTGSSMEDTRMG